MVGEAFGNRNYSWQPRELDLSNAQDQLELKVAGDLVRLDAVSDPTAAVDVVLNDPAGGPRRTMRLGSEINGAAFDRLFLSWAAQDGVTVTLLIGTTHGVVRFQGPTLVVQEP